MNFITNKYFIGIMAGVLITYGLCVLSRRTLKSSDCDCHKTEA